MKPAAIYCRISKDLTGEALGVERQERLCRDLAAQRGLDVVDVFTDNDVSAYSTKRRPGFEALLEAVEAKRVRHVIVYAVDRLYRRVLELERIVGVVERTGVKVLTVSGGDVDLSTAAGRHVARILGSTAQAESERMSERLRAKTDDLARTGRPPGGPTPYGFSSGYVVNEDEARWVRWAADRALAGWSLVRLAREMDEQGVPTRQGKARWHHSTVRNILVNPAIAGLRVHRREVAGPASWPAIIERGQWEQLRAVLADPARKKRRSGGPYLLSGMVRSPAGDHANGALKPPEGRAYTTRTGAAVAVSIGADVLESAVVEAVLIRFDGATLPTDTPAGTPDVDGIEAELAELARLRGEGVISLEEWLAAREPLQRRLKDAKAAVPTSTPLPHLGESLRAVWPTLDAVQRQAVLRAVIESVIVTPTGRNRYVRIEDRVEVRWRA